MGRAPNAQCCSSTNESRLATVVPRRLLRAHIISALFLSAIVNQPRPALVSPRTWNVERCSRGRQPRVHRVGRRVTRCPDFSLLLYPDVHYSNASPDTHIRASSTKDFLPEIVDRNLIGIFLFPHCLRGVLRSLEGSTCTDPSGSGAKARAGKYLP